MEEKEVIIRPGDTAVFHNHVDGCIGTGRMDLALTAEYQEQLAMVQEAIGFSYIRGHGLLCDGMAIYQETEDGTAEYNFTYLDRVMDSYRRLGLKPFLELGFMPEKLASGTQTIFYWKGNTTPPADYERWASLVQAVLRHLLERYGREEVLTWPVEVWNEPNLPGFWENADMQEYFRLFHVTFDAVKEADAGFHVGGPAVCGGTDEIWIRSFLEYCRSAGITPDFVTRHHYNTDFPQHVGHYGYVNLTEQEKGFANLHTTREIIDSFPEYCGMEIHITEFNTSYIPNCPTHDTNQNAAYIARQLARLGEEHASYSYWTFGDVFEEQGIPFTPFHGGFGLVANGCIPKPTYWTFVFFKRLKQKAHTCVYRDDDCVVVRCEDGSYRGTVWNTTNVRSGRTMKISFSLPLPEGRYCLTRQLVDEETCNPLKVWHDLGEPSSLTQAETQLLREASRPQLRTETLLVKGEDGEHGASEAQFDVVLSEHAVLYFACDAAPLASDRGYSYERTMQFCV